MYTFGQEQSNNQTSNDSSVSLGTVTAGELGRSLSNSDSIPGYDGDWLGWLRRRAEAGDEAALDKLFSYYMSEGSAETARNWSASREDTGYQRLVADMKAAGFNPYALLAQQGSPIASSSDGRSYSGTQWTNQRHNEETEKTNWSKTILSSLLTVASIAVTALLLA